MSNIEELAAVAECTVDGCSYNHNGCHAAAVTIGTSANCATFIPLDIKGGLPRVTTHVGACQRNDCGFNEHLECSASTVRIGSSGDTADCLTYTAR